MEAVSLRKRMKNKTARELAKIALFVALMTICAWIHIPSPLPFTMQTFGLFLCWGCLGGRRGSLAVVAYLLLGFIGAPVFSGFAGCAAFFGPGGGYLVGFLFSSLLFWGLEPFFGEGKGLCVRMGVGLLLCHAVGSAWYLFVYAAEIEGGVWAVLSVCVLPYLAFDLMKLALALPLCKKIKRRAAV